METLARVLKKESFLAALCTPHVCLHYLLVDLALPMSAASRPVINLVSLSIFTPQ